MRLESLSLRDSYDILLEKRLSGIAGLRHTILYGKSQFVAKNQKEYHYG